MNIRFHSQRTETNNSLIQKTTLNPIHRPLKQKSSTQLEPWKKQSTKWRAVKLSRKMLPEPTILQNKIIPPQRCLHSNELKNACQHLRQEFAMILELWIDLCNSQLSMSTSIESMNTSPPWTKP